MGMGDWFETAIDFGGELFDDVGGVLTGAMDLYGNLSDGQQSLLQLGLGSLAKDSFAAKVPQVGYQGKIPDYDAIRSRVPMQSASEGQQSRRPGEAGRRYFSDTLYATSPENRVPPTVEGAQGIADAQAMQLAQRNNPNAFPPALPPPPAESAPVGGIPSIPTPVDSTPSPQTGGSYVDLGEFGGTVWLNNDGSISSGPNQPPVGVAPPPAAEPPMSDSPPMMGTLGGPVYDDAGNLIGNLGSAGPIIGDQLPVNAPQAMAAGGIASAHNGYYLGGKTDGMADDVPATIDGTQEARLSDGEFVIPADVVSHLGNGNSDAGADQLHGMMDNVRMERTGNSEQGKQIDPNKFMPTMAQGGGIAAYNYGGSVYQRQPKINRLPAGGAVSTNTGGILENIGAEGGEQVGKESSLSTWAGDYVTDMLGQGKALANQGYQAYEGPLSAGTDTLQDQAYTGVAGLSAPADMGAYTPQTFGAEEATAGMNPYLMASLNPQIDEARRQNEIDRVANAGRMTQAGAFGGSRQALMDMEGQRNLQSNIADITGKGYASAYDRAQQQFNTQQDRNMKAQNQANEYGFDVFGVQEAAGGSRRDIESQGMGADYAQFREERDYPYKQVQYMQSLLQGLPLEAQSFAYSQPSTATNVASGTAGLRDLLKLLS